MKVGLHAFFSFFLNLLTLPPSHEMADGENASGGESSQARAIVSASSSHLPFKIELPAPFRGEGTEPFSSWIQRFEVALPVAASPLEKAKRLPVRLTGPAFAYWQSLSPTVQADYTLTKASLSTVFG